MAVRKFITERIAMLKKAGYELPIISELVIPATIITSESYVPPTLAEIPGDIGDIQRALMGLPSFAYGKAYGETAGQWYRVKYPQTISGARPVCVAEGRAGEILTRTIDKVSDISLREVARIARGDLRETIGNAYRDECIKILGDWSIFNWMRDAIATVFYGVGWITGAWLEWMWDILIQPQIDKVRDRINDSIKDINAKINFQVDRVTAHLNERLGDLYRMWGLPENMAVTPVHIRNATDSGFDFQSYGKTTIHYIAIGKWTPI